MRIVNLMEDTPGCDGCEYEHGLSIYIEIADHKILVDTGASEKTWHNAAHLGIDVSAVDTVILSHGHYDHSGGILSFASLNPHARIFMRNNADGEYYSTSGELHYIGIDKRITSLSNLVLTGETYDIDNTISLFSAVNGERLRPAGNSKLKIMRKDGTLDYDDFSHEQNAVIRDSGRNILICGCAHRGILNILDRYRELHQGYPDIVIGGFHMVSKNEEYTAAETAEIIATAEELNSMPTVFYTGHCTGSKAFEIMHGIMSEKLTYMHSGCTIA